jgi:hypothetical protein
MCPPPGTSSRPDVIRKRSAGTDALGLNADPVERRHSEQWHAITGPSGASISNLTPSHKHFPWSIGPHLVRALRKLDKFMAQALLPSLAITDKGPKSLLANFLESPPASSPCDRTVSEDPRLLGDLAKEAEDHGQRIFAWHDFTRNILRVISARPTSYLLPERDRPTRVL